MSEILNKISSYNIFNYLFPGAVFVTLAAHFGILKPPSDELVQKLLWFYFVGLTISRVGSVAIEPLLRKVRFAKEKSAYGAYLTACEKDQKLEVMLEVSNTYRTLVTAFGVLLVSMITVSAVQALGVSVAWRDRSVMVLLLALFLLSFRNQDEIVTQRVVHYGKR